MPIDWFTVIAQVINFLVLLWLLKRFLYHPILNAIDARETRIAAELTDADGKRAEAEKQREIFLQKNAEFDEQQAARLNQLAQESKKARLSSLEAVRLESEELRKKLHAAVNSEQLSLKQAIRHRAQNEVYAITRKVLNDLADTSLEQRMTTIFINRLHDLNDDEMAELQSAFKASTKSQQSQLLVRSAFALAEEQRLLIKTAIREILGEDIHCQFGVAADLVSGIELSANGQKIAWSITDYLDSLAKSVDQLLQTSNDVAVDADIKSSVTTQQGHHEISP